MEKVKLIFKSESFFNSGQIVLNSMDDFSNHVHSAFEKELDVTESTRKEKGITQKELADGAKIGLSTVKQYETGKRVPEKHNLSLIANYFGVLEGWIVGDTPYKTIFEKIDGELGEERLSDLRNQVEILTWLEHNFDFHCEDYTAEQLQKLDEEIREFIKFKISQLQKQ